MARLSAFGVSFCVRNLISLQFSGQRKTTPGTEVQKRANKKSHGRVEICGVSEWHLRSTAHFDRFESASELLWKDVVYFPWNIETQNLRSLGALDLDFAKIY
jgi:hypothetical protein